MPASRYLLPEAEMRVPGAPIDTSMNTNLPLRTGYRRGRGVASALQIRTRWAGATAPGASPLLNYESHFFHSHVRSYQIQICLHHACGNGRGAAVLNNQCALSDYTNLEPALHVHCLWGTAPEDRPEQSCATSRSDRGADITDKKVTLAYKVPAKAVSGVGLTRA